MRYKTTFLAITLALIAPLFANAQTTDTPAASDSYAFKRSGVFGCSLQGSYSMSVGAMAAVGGIYVPVNDAAVTLNTGYLVYKECVLRGVVNRQREAATAGTVKQVISTTATGRDGNPLYLQKVGTEQLDVNDKAWLRILQDGSLETVNPAFNTAVKRAAAQGYVYARNNPTSQFRCSYSGNLKAALEGKEFRLATMGQLMNPACNPYFAYEMVQDYTQGVASYDVNNLMTQLGWGEGFYPVQQCDELGRCTSVTPSSVVRSNFTQALQTGFDQQARANDIDQMVGALFSGITSQVLGDSRGIQGLIQKTGSQSSYIDQVVRESAQGLRDAAGNAALQILVAAKQVETGFKQAMEAIASLLASTAQDLRAKESACWSLIIQKVCATPLAADNTCTSTAGACTTDPTTGEQTCPTGDKLKVATSTTRSQQVITARIASYASTTVVNIEKSNQALVLVDRLIAGITNSSSLDAQRVALQQLDNLVAQRALHNQYDLQAAQKARDDVTATMETLITDTVKAWADSPDPNVGWCNVNNNAVLDMWKTRWKS